MSTTADLDEIYQQYSGTVTAYLTRLSGSPELAEELMQETFCRAVKNIDRFDGRSSVYTWLCGIAKHLYFDSLRRRKPTEPLPEEIPGNPTVRCSPCVPSVICPIRRLRNCLKRARPGPG